MSIGNYRNPRILDLARESPCQHCGIMDGTIVACHSDQIRDGKGTGIKSHDFRVAYMCAKHHFEMGDGNKLSREERREMFEEAHRKTIGWLFVNGHIIIQ